VLVARPFFPPPLVLFTSTFVPGLHFPLCVRPFLYPRSIQAGEPQRGAARRGFRTGAAGYTRAETQKKVLMPTPPPPPPVSLTGGPDERDPASPRFALGSLTTITLAHDYLCPWCWVGFHHARRLADEFGVAFDWRGFELIPPGMDFDPGPPPDPDAPPSPPSRFDRFAEEEGVEMPSPRPPFVRSHRALLGAEFARESGRFDDYNEAVYRAYWERREDIADLGVLRRLAEASGLDGDAFAASVEVERYAENVVPFDDSAYALGVRHVPTFIFGAEEKLAEAHYADLARAAERFLVRAQRWKGGTR
jgi:predicted DsbA family dithiol-disulfide isomerase